MNKERYIHAFFNSLVDLLNVNQIDFVILRNFYTLPEKLKISSDIDILVDSNSNIPIEKILREDKNISILISVKRIYVEEFIVKYKNEFIIKIDFHPFEQWRGFIFLSSQAILKEKTKYKNFNIPSESHQASISFFTSFLNGGFIKKRYISDIKSTLTNKPATFDELIPQFGKENIFKIKEYINGNISENKILSLRINILLHLIIFNLIKDFKGSLQRFFLSIIDELRLRVRYKGLIIHVDGNSTDEIINIIQDYIIEFVNSDRITILNKKSTLKSKFKTYDSLGRTKFIIYNQICPFYLQTPNLHINKVDVREIQEKISNYLIHRENQKYSK